MKAKGLREINNLINPAYEPVPLTKGGWSQ